MKIFLVCLLVGIVVATNSPMPKNVAWRKNTEYRYIVEGRTLTSMHEVNDEYVGILIRADMVLYLRSNGMLTGRIENPLYAEVHVNLPNGWDSEIPYENLNYNRLPMSSQQFDVELTDGVVTQVYVEQGVANWEANMIKGFVSQIQVDLQGQNLIPSSVNQRLDTDKFSGTFKVMEDTVTGKCETLYDIFQLPVHVLQNQMNPLDDMDRFERKIGIVKTKNYDNCDQIASYHYGLPEMFADNVYGNLGQILSKSSVGLVKIIGNGDRYTIHSSSTVNKIITSPLLSNSQKGMVVSRVNISLAMDDNTIEEPSELLSPISVGNLVYSYNQPFSATNKARHQPDSNEDQNIYYTKSSEWENAESSEERRVYEQRYQNVHSSDPRKVILSWDVAESAENSEEKRVYENQYRKTNAPDPYKLKFTWDTADDASSEEFKRSYLKRKSDEYQLKPTLYDPPNNPLLPYFVGNEGHSIKFRLNIVEDVIKVARKLAEAIQHPGQGTHMKPLQRFQILTELIRLMNKNEVMDVLNKLWESHHRSKDETFEILAWKVFRDALAQAGTGPAFLAIRSAIETDKISGEEAGKILATLPHTVSHPTMDYVLAAYKLCTSSKVQRQAGLNETAILSFSELVRKAFVNYEQSQSHYPQHTFNRLVSENEKYEFITNEYIPYLKNQLQHAYRGEDSPSIQVYIRALGNLAHAQILTVFKPYLEGERKITQFQRTLMVLCMDELTRTYPQEAQSVLYKLYSNIGDDVSVRVAAVFLLMETAPSLSMLQRMADFTNFDPSVEVRAAVKYAVESATKLKEPAYVEFAQNARAAVKLLKEENFENVHINNYLYQYITEEMKMNINQMFQSADSLESITAAVLKLTLRQNGAKRRAHDVLFSSMTSNTRILQHIINQATAEWLASPNALNQNDDARERLEKVTKFLDVQQLTGRKSEPLEANFLIELFGSRRFFAFDESSIKNLLKNRLKYILQAFDGTSRNYTKLFDDEEVTIGCPTEMGLPFVFHLNKPALVNVGGKMDIQQNAFGFKLELNVINRVNSKIGFVTPFDRSMYFAGYNAGYELYLPIDGKVSPGSEGWEIKLGYLYPWKKENILRYSSHTYTAKRNLLDLEPAKENFKPSETRQQYSQLLGEENGIVCNFHWESERPIHNLISFEKELLSIIAGDSIKYRLLHLQYAPDLSSAPYVIINFDVNEMKKHLNIQNKETESGFASRLASLKTSQNKERDEYLANRVASGMKSVQTQVVDVTAYFPGKNHMKYIASWASVQNSEGQDLHRHIWYLRKVNENQHKNYHIYASMEDHTDLSNVLIRYGEYMDNAAEIKIKLMKEQSEKRRAALRQVSQGMSESLNYPNMLFEAARIDRMYVEIEYNGVGEVFRNLTKNQLASYGYNYYWDAMDMNSVNPTTSGSAYRINVQIELDPENLHYANVTVKTPESDTVFKNMNVNSTWLRNFIPVKHKSDIIDETSQNLIEYPSLYRTDIMAAQIIKNSVQTFDNRKYPIALRKCDHILLHAETYLPTDYSYTVLAHDSAAMPNKKELRIIYTHFNKSNQIVLKPAKNDRCSKKNPCTEVYMNDKLINRELSQLDGRKYNFDNQVKILVQKNGVPQISFNRGEFIVVYLNPEHIRFHLTKKYARYTRGLLRANGEHNSAEYITRQRCSTNDPEEFAHSYAIVTKQCDRGLPRYTDRSCSTRRNTFASVVNLHDAHEHTLKSALHRCSTRHQTRYIIMDSGKTVCFTLRALPVCSKGCRHNTYVEKRVEVFCTEHSSLTDSYIKSIDRGATLDLSAQKYKRPRTIKIKIPSVCN